jgi:hypothetical protein
MAKKTRPTFQKRQKEQARQQKRQDKAARRLEAKQRRANTASERGESPLESTGTSSVPQSGPALGDPASEQA